MCLGIAITFGVVLFVGAVIGIELICKLTNDYPIDVR